MDIFISILFGSILPIFILIALGFILDKKFKLDLNTLTKLNFYLYVPAFSFVNIYTTDISFDLLNVILITVLLLALNFGIGALLAKALRLPSKTGKAFENAIMFYNSGNIGISLITLVFSSAPFTAADGSSPLLNIALSVQVMVLLVQNLSTNTIGFINSGGEGMTLKKGIIRVLKMPAPYAILSALLLKLVPFDFKTIPVWPTLDFLRSGLVSIALVTLGAQLAKTKLMTLDAQMGKTKIDMRFKTLYLAVFLRLIGGPAAALLLIKIFGFTGVLAQAVFISASTPTAVNTALLSAECKGDEEFAVHSVTLCTIMSAVTMTTVVYLAYVIF